MANNYAAEVTADGPVAWWRLAEASGVVADDAIGAANGLYSGAPTLGAAGPLIGDLADTAVQLDGTNDYVELPLATPSTAQGTYEGWVKRVAWSANQVFGRDNTSTSGTGWILAWSNGTALNFRIAGTDFNSGMNAAALADGNWHHIAITWNGTTVKYYVDGVLRATVTKVIAAWASPWRFGRQGAASSFIPAYVDEIAVYAVPLSDARIAVHYAARVSVQTLNGGGVVRVPAVAGATVTNVAPQEIDGGGIVRAAVVNGAEVYNVEVLNGGGIVRGATVHGGTLTNVAPQVVNGGSVVRVPVVQGATLMETVELLGGSVVRAPVVNGATLTYTPPEDAPPGNPEAEPPEPDPIFTDAWSSARQMGALMPHQVVEIQRGRWNRGYRRVPTNEIIDADIPGESRDVPWMAWWDAYEPWREMPGVLLTKLNQDFTQNGQVVAVIDVENTRLVEETGPGGEYHVIERGHLSPERGYTAPGRDQAGGEATEWSSQLNKKAKVRVWRGYGPPQRNEDGSMPDDGGPNGGWEFVGQIDDIDSDARPDRITITARTGSTLTDSRMFGWNKSKQLKDPITFADRSEMFTTELAGRDADSSSELVDSPASHVLDKSAKTRWISDPHSTWGNTEWVQIRLPAGRYRDFILHPAFSGMEAYIGFYARGATVDGVSVPDGWVSLDAELDEPGAYRETSVSQPIPDDDADGVVIPLDFTGEPGVTDQIEVRFHITHTYVGDLDIYLEDPSGNRVYLANEQGESDNDYGLSADDPTIIRKVGPALETGNAPFLGSWGADGDLSLHEGKVVSGVWKFVVIDRAGADIGSVEYVRVRLTPDTYTGGSEVPGAHGGWKYTRKLDYINGRQQTRKIGAEIVTNDDSILRIGFRNLNYDPFADNYRAGVRRLQARNRVFEEGALEKRWIYVEDAADVVRTVLRWAGFREWDVESTGVALKHHVTFNRATYNIDIINEAAKQTGYLFFMQRPSHGDGLAIPTFRYNSVLYEPPTDMKEITQADMLRKISVKNSEEPLAYIIRVRGKTAVNGLPLGGDSSKRIMATYRPPWSYRLEAEAENPDRLAGVLKHVTLTQPELRTFEECGLYCRMVALRERLAAERAVVEIPGHYAYTLDTQVGVKEAATATDSRLWIGSWSSEFVAGHNGYWISTLEGPLLDKFDIIELVREMEEYENQ